jgi:hypothetical protein
MTSASVYLECPQHEANRREHGLAQAMRRQSQLRGGGCDRERVPEDIRVYGSFVQEDGVMAEVRETEEVRQWRAKVTTFNFDVDCVGGTMTGLLQRAMELEQERVALGLDDMAVVDAASAQKLIDRATALRGLASRDPL